MDLPAAWALHAETWSNRTGLTAKGTGKVVRSGASDLVILRDIDLEITRGEAMAVIGASGSGKSTLLAILAGLDTPSAGRVEIDGADLFALDEDARARLRAMQVGFVFQSFQLLPGYTALENVMLPLELADHPEAEKLSSEILDRVGLGERLSHYPKHLSGGEQQRVALARAFVVRPKLLLADEPTGSLDADSGAGVIRLLFDLNREYGTTLVIVTHDESLAGRCSRMVRLAAVKGVTDTYPLRGQLRIAPDVPVERGPARGTVWLEERLISSLNAPVGSRIRLGRADFEVAAVLTLEPERSANFFNIAPRLMMNLADVPATGLIQTGSRVWYYLYAAGEPKAIQQLETFISQKLERGQRVDNLESGRPEVRASIERARRFLALTALLAAVLAGVAIALGTRRFVERHLDGCAVMRCLGATQRQLVALYGFEFALLGIAACAVGVAFGYAAQLGIAAFLAGLLQAELPPPGLLPALQGFLVGLVLLLGFALPPLLQLKNVPAVRVIRREGGAPKGSALAAYALGMAVLAALLIWQAGDLTLGG